MKIKKLFFFLFFFSSDVAMTTAKQKLRQTIAPINATLTFLSFTLNMPSHIIYTEEKNVSDLFYF